MPGSEGSPKLTVRDRILVHLSEYPAAEGAYEVPHQVVQSGVVAAVGIKLSHLPQYVRPMIREGVVGEQLARVEGGRQRQKSYFLTPQGRNEASRIRGNLLSRSVELVEPDGHRSAVVLRDAVKGPLSGIPLLELLYSLDADGSLRVPVARETVAPAQSRSEPAQPVLELARTHEADYDWLAAAEVYRSALSGTASLEPSTAAYLHARAGYAFYRAAFQADRIEDYGERLRQALQEYETAKEDSGPWRDAAAAWAHYCHAWIAHVGFWRAGDAASKRPLIVKAWEHTKLALQGLKAAHAVREYGYTYNELSYSAIWSFALETDSRARSASLQEAVDLGEEAIRCLNGTGDREPIAHAYAQTAAYFLWLSYYFVDVERRDRYYHKALSYWSKAYEENSDAALAELPMPFFKGLGSAWGDGAEQSLAHLERTLAYAKKTRDKFLIGSAYDWLALHTFLRADSLEDPKERIGFVARAREHAEAARAQFAPISFRSPRGGAFWSEAPYAEYYRKLAGFETDAASKRAYLGQALGAAETQLETAVRTEYPEVLWLAHDVLSRTLVSLADLEIDGAAKTHLLERALEHEHESRRIAFPLLPYSYGVRGNQENLLADIKAGLATVTSDPETKRGILDEAIVTKRASLELSSREVPFVGTWGVATDVGTVALHQYEYGTLLFQFHELTQDKRDVRRSTDAFLDAAASYEKAGLPTRSAECHWKAAEAFDGMGDHAKAAEHFASASDFFRIAAATLPNLEGLYSDYAIYMQAWCEIEKAHDHHARQEFGRAKEYYERAATLHKFSKNWGFLTANYAAWAQVENGEELSRKEPERAAIQAFEQAARLFQETKQTILAGLRKEHDDADAHNVEKLLESAELRRRYCLARVSLEEARLLDKQGELSASSERYGLAAETLGDVARAMQSDQDRRDINLIATLSRAWQTMTKAETESSSELYGEAALIFDQARTLSSHEKAKMLAWGHSRFCRALQAGTRYMDLRERSIHADTIHHLEAAGTYYLKAGARSASDYAQGSKMLFQAYGYMDAASLSGDQEEKTKYYLMTERVLQAASAAFAKAGHDGKVDEVVRLQEHVREDRELAVSLSQVLRVPAVMAATTVFSTPTPTQERAVGLERFENADVWMIVRPREWSPKVGQSFPLEIELTNAGRGLAQLIKIQDVIPEGFEPVETSERSQIAGRDLTMKGFRLEPLKTVEEKVVVTPGRRGVVILKPKLVFLGADGRARAFEPSPLEISVD